VTRPVVLVADLLPGLCLDGSDGLAGLPPLGPTVQKPLTVAALALAVRETLKGP